MGIADKTILLGRAEREMKSFLTAEKMDMVLRVLSDELDGFELSQKPTHDSAEQDDLLKIYLDALRVGGRSEKTIKLYRYVLKRLMADTGIPTKQITVYHLRNWLATEKARGVQDGTLESDRQVFSAYFNWLQRENLIEKNPTANLGAIKRMKKQKKIYTQVELEKLNNACIQIRDRAILAFLRSTGCRISEMTGLDRVRVNLQKQECLVLGKGNKERTVYLDPVASMLIEQYLAQRTDDNPALFIGKGNERIQPGGVRTMLNKLADKAGVEHVHPHKFRRTLATNLIRHGMPIQEVANILGHDKLDTTMKYVVMNNDDLQHSYRRFYT